MRGDLTAVEADLSFGYTPALAYVFFAAAVARSGQLRASVRNICSLAPIPSVRLLPTTSSELCRLRLHRRRSWRFNKGAPRYLRFYSSIT